MSTPDPSQQQDAAALRAASPDASVASAAVADPTALIAALDPAAAVAVAVASRPREQSPWGHGAWVADDVEQHPAVRVLRRDLPEAVEDLVRFRDETTIHVRRDLLREVCRRLREDPETRLDFLSDVTAVDMLRLRERPRFDVVVTLYSLTNRSRLRLKAGCDDGLPVPSLVPLWNGANWLEREAYDMFGIVFDGHPNLRRILLPDDWEEGHPLRKDYPLRGWREFPVYNTERTVGRMRTRWTGRGVS